MGPEPPTCQRRPRTEHDSGASALPARCPCLAEASAAQSPCSQPGPLPAASRRARALAACARPSPSAFWAGRHGTGHGATASHIPHGSPAVPPCHSELRGACGLRNRLLLWQHVGLGPPSAGGTQPWPQPQPLPSLAAPLAPASKSGADVEARLGACLRLGTGSIGVAPFLPCSLLLRPHCYGRSPQCLMGDRARGQTSLFGSQMGTTVPSPADGVCRVPKGNGARPYPTHPVPYAGCRPSATQHGRDRWGQQGCSRRGTALPAWCCWAGHSPTCSQLSPWYPNLWVLPCHAGGLAEVWRPSVPVPQPPRWAPRSQLPRGSSRLMFAKFCLVKP